MRRREGREEYDKLVTGSENGWRMSRRMYVGKVEEVEVMMIVIRLELKRGREKE
jgi:hypothetical protein